MLRTLSRRSSLGRKSVDRPGTSLSQSDSATERERVTLAELKELCRKNSVNWSTSDTLPPKAVGDSLEESILLRYLRARKYDVNAAYKQYAASVKWRHDTQLEKTYDDVDIAKFETIRRLQPQWTGRCDSTGVPIMVYVVSQVKAEDIFALHKTDPALSSVFLAAEYVTQFVQPLCGMLKHEHVTTSINIIDLSHVGVSTFWRLRKLLSTASNMATAHYPETVKRIYVVGAPSFFPTVWNFINAWFEPATTRKITVLNHRESTTVLNQDLGSENVPQRFGGDLEWEFGNFPSLSPDSETVSKKLMAKWVDGPLRTFSSQDGQFKILAVGSQGTELRREVL